MVNIPVINGKNELMRPSSTNLSTAYYAGIMSVVKAVGGTPVTYVKMEELGSASRPKKPVFGTPHFHMGMLPLSATIYGIDHVLDEADRQSLDIFIGTLHEWLPEQFLENIDLLMMTGWCW